MFKDKIEKLVIYVQRMKINGYTDLEIAKYIHIELEKLLIYDNSYTANYNKNDNEEITQTSKKRQKMLLDKKTDTSKNTQICKGMAEIYVAILKEVGISANVVGAESKGDVDGFVKNGKIIDVPQIYECSFDENFEITVGKNQKDTKKEAKHYYTELEINGVHYVQDFLIDEALYRIKVGEANLNENLPGFCHKEDYKIRSNQSIPLADEYTKKFNQNMKHLQIVNQALKRHYIFYLNNLKIIQILDLRRQKIFLD